jgi:hypothetical protein
MQEAEAARRTTACMTGQMRRPSGHRAFRKNGLFQDGFIRKTCRIAL